MREPLHAWSPPRQETYGDLAAGLAEQVGMPMDVEQQLILDDIFAENEPGVPACFEVGVIAPRQNLKTATLEIAALTDVFILGEELHVWTAHLFDTAQRAFNDMVAMIGRTPDLRSRCKWPPSASHGDEEIELLSGQKIEFHARSSGKGRGFSSDKITLDEALYLTPHMMGALLPTLATRPGAQVRYGSSAGLLQSRVLRGVRDRGRKGGNPRLAYWEWGAPVVDCRDKTCDHAAGTYGCALDREDLLRRANPALGRRISMAIMADFRQSMPPEEFAREFLSWWEDPVAAAADELAVAPDVWAARGDADSTALDPVSLGIDVSPIRQASITAVGWRSDGSKHAELVWQCPTGHVVDVLRRIVEQVDPAAIALDAAGPAGSLIPAIEAAGFEVLVTNGRQRSQADRGLVDDLEQADIHVVPCQALDGAADALTWRYSGDAAYFNRRAGKGDISPMVSLSVARHGLLTVAAHPLPPPPSRARPLEDEPLPQQRDDLAAAATSASADPAFAGF